MIRLAMARGTYDVETDTVEALSTGTCWVANIDRGLCVQKHPGWTGLTYGVTHHSGWAVSVAGYRYGDAQRLQQRLLALAFDWTQTAEDICAVCRRAEDPQWYIVGALLREWKDRYWLWHDDECWAYLQQVRQERTVSDAV